MRSRERPREPARQRPESARRLLGSVPRVRAGFGVFGPERARPSRGRSASPADSDNGCPVTNYGPWFTWEHCPAELCIRTTLCVGHHRYRTYSEQPPADEHDRADCNGQDLQQGALSRRGHLRRLTIRRQRAALLLALYPREACEPSAQQPPIPSLPHPPKLRHNEDCDTMPNLWQNDQEAWPQTDEMSYGYAG